METTFDDLSVPTLTEMALEKGLIKNKNQAKTLKKAGLVDLLQAWQQEQTLAKIKTQAVEALAASEQALATTNQFGGIIGEMMAEAQKLADELVQSTHVSPAEPPCEDCVGQAEILQSVKALDLDDPDSIGNLTGLGLPPVLDPNAVETLPAPPMPEESFAYRMARKYNTSSTPNLLTPRQEQIKAHNRRKNKAARKARKKNKR